MAASLPNRPAVSKFHFAGDVFKRGLVLGGDAERDPFDLLAGNRLAGSERARFHSASLRTAFKQNAISNGVEPTNFSV